MDIDYTQWFFMEDFLKVVNGQLSLTWWKKKDYDEEQRKNNKRKKN